MRIKQVYILRIRLLHILHSEEVLVSPQTWALVSLLSLSPAGLCSHGAPRALDRQKGEGALLVLLGPWGPGATTVLAMLLPPPDLLSGLLHPALHSRRLASVDRFLSCPVGFSQWNVPAGQKAGGE